MPDSIERSVVRMEVPYFQTPNDIFDLNLNLNIYQKMVYLYLCRCCNQGAQAFPSYATIGTKCGMSRRKAIDTVKELINYNLLVKEVRTKKNKKNSFKDLNDSNIYLLNQPSACSAPSQCTANTTLVQEVQEPGEQDAPQKELYKTTKKKKVSKVAASSDKSKGNFNNFPQRTYNFDKLEKGLLGQENINIEDV